MKIEVHQPPDGPICDFCSRRPVKWHYPAKDIRSVKGVSVPGLIDQDSIGDWAACQTCHDLIEAGDNHGLANRTAQSMVAQYRGVDPNTLLLPILVMQQEFRNARTGPAIPVE